MSGWTILVILSRPVLRVWRWAVSDISSVETYAPAARKIRRPKMRLGLPDWDQSKAAVIGSLRSPRINYCHTR